MGDSSVWRRVVCTGHRCVLRGCFLVCVNVAWWYAKDWLCIFYVKMRVVRKITKAWALELCGVRPDSL